MVRGSQPATGQPATASQSASQPASQPTRLPKTIPFLSPGFQKRYIFFHNAITNPSLFVQIRPCPFLTSQPVGHSASPSSSSSFSSSSSPPPRHPHRHPSHSSHPPHPPHLSHLDHLLPLPSNHLGPLFHPPHPSRPFILQALFKRLVHSCEAFRQAFVKDL